MSAESLLIGLSLIIAAGLVHAADAPKIGTMAAPDELEWQALRPGSPIKIAILWGDRDKGEYAMLLRLPAGYASPVHAHTGAYHGISLTGTWRHSFEGGEERDLPPGSYVFQPGMGMHGDGCVGSEDCILFIHQQEKADYIAKP